MSRICARTVLSLLWALTLPLLGVARALTRLITLSSLFLRLFYFFYWLQRKKALYDHNKITL